jgi:hypothetical protein
MTDMLMDIFELESQMIDRDLDVKDRTLTKKETTDKTDLSYR